MLRRDLIATCILLMMPLTAAAYFPRDAETRVVPDPGEISVRLGGVVVQGVHETDAVRAGLREVSDEVTQCFLSLVERHELERQHGSLAIRLEVTATNEVRSVAVTQDGFAYSFAGELREGGEKLLELAPCVVQELSRAKVPGPRQDDSSNVDIAYFFSVN